MKPGLFVLQYWQGDRERALRMARFYAQIQPGQSRHTFALTHRFDAEPPDARTLELLAAAFTRVVVIPGTTQLTGHPDGCWALWRDSVVWLRAHVDKYEFGVFFEADCTPIYHDWAERIAQAVSASDPALFVFGHHVPDIPGCRNHVNGNCGVRADAAKLDQLLAFHVPRSKPWDVYITPFFVTLGIANLPVIRSIYIYDADGFDVFDSLRTAGCALHHGDKRGHVQKAAAQELLGGPGYEIRPAPALFRQDETTGRYVFPDPDKVPTLAEQAAAQGARYTEIRVEDHTFSTLKYIRYNASIGAGGKFATRRQLWGLSRVQTDWVSAIELGTIDLDSGVAKVDRTAGIREVPGMVHTHIEDPRLSTSAGREVLSFTRAHMAPTDPIRMQHGFFIDGAEEFLDVGSNRAHNATEKNWAAFDGPNPAYFYFVYSTSPFVVVRVPRAGGPIQYLRDGSQALVAWEDGKFGQPRGGTPAIFIEEFGGYLSMFHSSIAERGRGRRYLAGWILFTVEEHGTSLRFASKTPVLRGSYADGFATPPGIRYWEPSAVFPAGIVRRGNDIFVSAGVNDSFSALFAFPLGSVLRSLRPG